jgi:hypothetical protein
VLVMIRTADRGRQTALEDHVYIFNQ